MPNLYTQNADGTGAAERLTTSPNQQAAASITPDGTRVVGTEIAQAARDVVAFPLAANRPGTSSSPGTSTSPAEPLVHTLFDEGNPEISPDGRYLAYQSNESRQFEIYVRPFPRVNDGRWEVSTGGGTRPAWSRDGRELFYLDKANTLMAVSVQTTGSTFSAGTPRRVFDTPYAAPAYSRTYDVSPAGRRFLMIKESAGAGQPSATTPATMVVVLNWFEELKVRVGAR